MTATLVYARAAIALGKRGIWKPEKVRAEANEGLRKITVLLTRQTSEFQSWAGASGRLDSGIRQEFEKMPDWEWIQEELSALEKTPRDAGPRIGLGGKRGPRPDYETASKVAEIVARVAPDGTWRSSSTLEDVCEDFDEKKVPCPKTWKTRGYRDWCAALAVEPSLVVKAITHHLKLHRRQENTLSCQRRS